MELSTIISKLYHYYQKIQQGSTAEFGLFSQMKDFGAKNAYLIVFLSQPPKPTKGKLKDFQKIVETPKLIIPKNAEKMKKYLNSIYAEIRKPKEEILEQIEELIIALRLGFLTVNNVKYIFSDENNPQIIVYDETNKGQFFLYLHAVDLIDKGLILAHEKQINYIKEQLHQGMDPLQITDLPPLRTGMTDLDLVVTKKRKEEKEKREERRRKHLIKTTDNNSNQQKKNKETLEDKKTESTDIEEERDKEENKQGTKRKMKYDMFGRPIG